jgi:WD40 repeat protein
LFRTISARILFGLLCLLTLAACQSKQPTPISLTSVVATRGPVIQIPAQTTRLAPETPKPSPGSATPSLPPVEATCFTPAAISPFAFTPDSQGILLRSMAGVQVFDLGTLQEKRFLEAPQNIITAALSPDGKIVALSLEDNSIQLVRLSDHQILRTLTGHSDMVTKLRFTPDGDELVSAAHDGWVKVWSMQGDLLRSFQPPGEVLGIGISPDGKMLATVPFDGPLTLWNLETLQKIKELGGSGGFDTSDAEFSRDGQIIAADLASGLYLWKVQDGKQIWDQGKNSMAVSFSPDGRYLAYADISQENKIFLSSVDGTQIFHEFVGHQAPVWELFFSPDSRLLASTDGNEIRIWGVEDGALRYLGKSACP